MDLFGVTGMDSKRMQKWPIAPSKGGQTYPLEGTEDAC